MDRYIPEIEFLDLLSGHGEFDSLSFRPPLYPLILAFFDISLSSLAPLTTIAAFFNVCLFTGSIWISTQIMHLLGLGRIRLLLFPLILLFPYFILENFILRETVLYTFMVSTFIYYILKCDGSLRSSLILGLIAGLASLTRPSGIIFLISGFFIFSFFGEKNISKRAIQSLVFVLTYFVLFAPWAAVLSYNSGQFVFSSSCTTGMNFFKGSSNEAGNIYLYSDVDKLRTPLEEGLPRCVADARLASLIKDQVFERAVSDPLVLLRDSTIKFTMFAAGVSPIGRASVEVHDDYTHSLSDTSLHMNSMFFLPIGIATYVLAALGCWIAISRGTTVGRRTLAAIGLLVLGHQAIHVITWPETRFTFPFILSILISALYLIDCLRKIAPIR